MNDMTPITKPREISYWEARRLAQSVLENLTVIYRCPQYPENFWLIEKAKADLKQSLGELVDGLGDLKDE